MTEQQRENRLSAAYERVLERMQNGANDLSWDNLQKDLDESVQFEADFEDFTKDEMALLRAWVERDLKDLRGYLAAGGSGVASWLGIDLDVLSRKITDALFSVADRSIIEREQLNDDLEASRADYVAGEIAAPGRMACVHCGAKVELKSVTRLEPCRECEHRYFERSPSA